MELSESNIFYLFDGIFEDLENLRNLDLSHNKIAFLPEKIFKPLALLETIDLRHNWLQQIRTELCNLKYFQDIKVNYFICNADWDYKQEDKHPNRCLKH